MATFKEQMKWLIVGGSGQLGRAMQTELSNSGINVLSFDRSQLDVTNNEKIIRIFKDELPDVVLNAAGWTNVDAAESAEEDARLVNAYGPGLLAKACSLIDAKFVHISTDYVFSGISKRPWAEESMPAPVSAYGRTKAEGEKLVQESSLHDFFIIRTSWLYSPWGKNFVKTMVRLALQEAGSVEVVCDQIGQPTSALDLAAQIHRMIDHDVAPGIYHGTNSGKASWFEFAQHIFELLGTDLDRIFPVDSAHYPRPAKRPMYSVLGHQRWIDEGLTPMRDWREALENVLPTIIQAMSLGE